MKRVFCDIGVEPDIEKQDFYICPDVDSFINLTGRTKDDYQTWMVGSASRKDKRICLLSPRAVTDRPPKAMESIAVHETVHIVFNCLADPEDLPAWVSEGVAVLYADQTNVNCLDENNCPRLCDVSGNDFAENGGYDYSGVYVWYFIEKYGFEAFKKLYCGAYPANWYYSEFEAEAVKSYKSKI